MPPRSAKVDTFKALAQELGITTLADIHARSVRDRSPPPRLVARIFREENTVLSAREREVMVLLTSGFSRQEIADEIGLSVETVKHYLKMAYAKLGVHGQIDAINAFLEEGA